MKPNMPAQRFTDNQNAIYSRRRDGRKFICRVVWERSDGKTARIEYYEQFIGNRSVNVDGDRLEPAAEIKPTGDEL